MMSRRDNPKQIWLIFFWLMILINIVATAPDACHALCASVKIEIQQELTLERQAFDAHMRINNGLSHIPIEDVSVTVSFADESGNSVSASSDPDDTSALFFISIDSMENIDSVDGAGSVAPETSADIHWLIIPASGASNGLQSGTLYFVGATLTYTAAGESETIEVTPDYIFVKPMPQLVLDYFMPTDVYGDDAWTDTIEAPVPFSLGLRISNKGNGYARSLTVESAQPKIVENESQLLIGFNIEGSQVNGNAATNDLLVDFGDIAPDSAATAQWILNCTLSGKITDFSAQFSHADELGGKMTSLIDEDDVRTHFLVHTVRVDVPGRDDIEDFLANDDDVYKVYESDNTESEVTNQSAGASLTAQANYYRLSTPPTSGFMFASVSDPFSGSMMVLKAIRSDGKQIKLENIWMSKTRVGNEPWQYYLNIFDDNSTGSYDITFQSTADIPQAPVIAYIPARTQVEGQQLSFIVEATDPNGTIPSLSVERLPITATFQDQGDGSAIFNWIPQPAQAGYYSVKFIATDGTLTASRQAVIRIFSQEDSDGDGMLDSWEMDQFGTLERDGSSDFDGDGILDAQEYANGFDPLTSQSAPSVPEIIYPQIGEQIDQLSIAFEIANSIDAEGDICTYTFEVSDDETFETLFASQTDVTEQSDRTSWNLPEALLDNTIYYWRVRASDSTGSSNWAYGRFFTNTQNDPPAPPVINSPVDGRFVDTTTPLLQIANAGDIDDTVLTYRFEVYSDSDMQTLITAEQDIQSGEVFGTEWTVNTPLDDNTTYYWRAIAVDGSGAETAGELSSFQIDTLNSAPETPAIVFPEDGIEIVSDHIDLTITNATDPDGDDLSYIFEIDAQADFNSAGKLSSGNIFPMDESTYWTVEGLSDNTKYYWRAQSFDGAASSQWVYGSFFVNAYNESPATPQLKNPAALAWVNTQTPVMMVHPVKDPDNDVLSYRFDIYGDQNLTKPVAYSETDTPEWTAISPLANSTWYYWRVQAVDQHGIPGQWSETGAFFVKLNGVDLPPALSFVTPDGPVHTNAQGIVIRWSDTDPDSNALVSLYYDTDTSGADGIAIIEGIEEDPDGTQDYYTWDISTLEGEYYIYAVIADSNTSEVIYCQDVMTIDHTAPVVTALPAGGSYSETANVELIADETAQIYYTLDGSEPDRESQSYETPIPISQDTVLRFTAIDTAGNQSGINTATYTFAASDITVNVSTDKGRALNAVRVYAFTSAGTYTGNYATTDSDGKAQYDPALFDEDSYKFRIDYLGGQYWSAVVNLPETRVIDVVIPEEDVVVSINTAAGPAAGVRVYLFNESGTYLGQYLTTDEAGQVTFVLPAGMLVLFRADLYGSQYWSEGTTVAAGTTTLSSVDAGGGLLQVEVNKSTDQPIEGIRVSLFNTKGSYLGHYATTDSSGRLSFDVPSGNYMVRADYLGYQFWSSATNVVTDTLATIQIPHQQIQLTVAGAFLGVPEPVDGINTYLFSASGAYLNIKTTTDENGQVTLDLPEESYMFRADYMGRQFWSQPFTWQDPKITIPLADAQVLVTGAGLPSPGIRTYLFSETNSYLGLYADTDSNGQCIFRLPEGVYRFRADYQDSQFWSAYETLTADQLNEIGISTGGGSFVFTVTQGESQPLAGAACYLFNEADSYLNLNETTNADGQVSFDLSDGAYKLRVDHLGYQFWSDIVNVPDTASSQITIPHTPVTVTVSTAAGLLPDTRVYLFADDGTYLGRYLETDSQGEAAFTLPAGVGYRFRADLSGYQYWSDTIVVPEDAQAQVAIDAGGGSLQLTVQDDAANPLVGLSVFLFSESGAYLNNQAVTDTTGIVAFDVPEGTYKLRIDYLGYSYWTDPAAVSQDTQVSFDIPHQNVNIVIEGQYQGVATPIPDIRVYLFTPTGSYLGMSLATDEQGQVTFNLPRQNYTVRADVMGDQYWSATFNQQDAVVQIPMADVQVSVTGAGLPREDISVYLFTDSGAYLGQYEKTDAQGQVRFHLPAGTYQFRADYQDKQFWSGVQTANADQLNPVVISVGGGTFSLTVQTGDAAPMAGIPCYVFSETGTYLGYFGATDDQGVVRFDLAEGAVQFRADYLGYQYWTQPVTVPDQMTEVLSIAHQDVAVTLSGSYLGSADPLSGQKMYLFSTADSYLGVNGTTDDNGQAFFTLPVQSYRIRADYLGKQYWTDPFQSQSVEIDVPQGAVDIHALLNGADVSGARVYLFGPADNYLGRFQVTDVTGWASFILPEGSYRFRVDFDGLQQWSEAALITSDQTATIEIEMQ